MCLRLAGKEVEDKKLRIVGQALPPARMEWFDRQECLSYTCGKWFLVVQPDAGPVLYAQVYSSFSLR